MRCKDLAELARVSAEMIEGSGGRSDQFRSLCAGLNAAGDLSVNKLASKIASSDAMLPDCLIAALKLLHAVLAAAASKAGPDCLALSRLPSDAATVIEFEQIVATALAYQKPKRNAGPKERLGASPQTIRDYADRLAGVEHDVSQFGQVVAELMAPGRFTNGELASIAVRFLGYQKKFSSRAQISKALLDRQKQDAVQSSAVRSLSKISV